MDKIKEFFNGKKVFLNNNPIYANPLKRLASFIIDMVIIMVIFNAILGVAGYFGFDSTVYREEIVVENKGTEDETLDVQETFDAKTFRKIYFGLLAVSSTYFVLFLSSKKQATIGNQIFKIMVVHTKEAKISVLSAFIRYIAMLLNNTIYGVGYLLYFFREDHAILQDILSDTRVINLKD